MAVSGILVFVEHGAKADSLS